jgi:hypothetical protein
MQPHHIEGCRNPGAGHGENGGSPQNPSDHHRARPDDRACGDPEDACARQARQVVFRGLSDGTVVIAKKWADDGDPMIGRCLAFLAHDMAIEPARIRPMPRSMVSRGKVLVKGVRVDLNAPIRDDKA